MRAAEYSIVVDRASEYNLVLTLKDSTGTALDLSPVGEDTYDFYSDIRDSATKKKVTDFSCSVLSPATSGKVNLNLSETKTRLLNGRTKYEWDLFMVKPGHITDRLLFGSLTARPNYTKTAPIQ